MKPEFIDMHAHWFPEALVEALRQRSSPPHIRREPDGKEYLFSGFNPSVMEQAEPIATRLAAMDRNGVQRGVLSLTGVYGIERLPIEDALPLCRIYNDAVAQVCLEHPDRFSAFAALPLIDSQAMVAEFERVMALPGFVGALLPSDGFLSQKRAARFAPLFAAANERGAVFMVHYGKMPDDPDAPKVDNSDNAHARIGTLDMQARISQNMLTFCMTDFLAAYPNVQIMSHNLGGNIPFEVERLDHRSMLDRPNDELPSARIRKARVIVDCNSLGARSIETAFEVYGPGRIVYGSDGTDFGMNWTNKAIDEARIPESEKDAIRNGTAYKALSRVDVGLSVAAE